MPRRRAVSAAGWLVLFLVGEIWVAAAPNPNVILILADGLRRDSIGAYNGGSFPTPGIDGLAGISVRFSWAYSPAPMSGPAYTSLFTSLYPHEHGLLNNLEQVPAGVWWLPEELRRRGYQTAAFVANGYCDQRFGFERGFDYFWSDRSRGKEAEWVNQALFGWLPTRDRTRPLFLFLVYMDTHTPFITPDLGANLSVTLDGKEIFRERGDNVHVKHEIPIALSPGIHDLSFHRLFPDRDMLAAGEEIEEGTFNIVTFAVRPGTVEWRRAEGWETGSGKFRNPHAFRKRARVVLANPAGAAIEARVEFQGWQEYTPRQFQALYGKCVSHLDRHLGEALGALDREDLVGQSLVIFLSDHGQGLGEHGLVDHVDQLYDSLLRIPLLIHWPGQAEGEERPGPVSLLDIPRTVLSAAGGAGEATEVRGVDLAEFPRDAERWSHRALYAETYPPEAPERLSAVLFGGWKLIRNHDRGTQELYHLLKDPGEVQDLSGVTSRTDLTELLEAWTRDAPARAGLRIEELSPEEAGELRAHGYLKN